MAAVMRSEACACGSVITAPEGDREAIARAVRLHNAGPAHTAWRLGVALVRERLSEGADGRGVWRVASDPGLEGLA